MRLVSLRLVNFRQHADSFVTFDTGLTGIIGANGSGKSTLLEAIAWALYGQDAARGKKETLRSLRAGPNARVKVERTRVCCGGSVRNVPGDERGPPLYLRALVRSDEKR